MTQVNEMLTQMESFHGIFIASTNLMDSLDAAAMRRFDARIHLGYLRPEAAWEMFNWLMHAFKLINTGEARTVLDQLNNLTPGDFAVVERHCRLDPVASGAELVGRLLKLSESKQGIARRPIGFVA